MSGTRHEPELIDWRDAQRRILEMASASASDRVVIGITGPVGAGKSTLAGMLSECVVSTDHYFPNYDETPTHLRDLPESSDLPRLASDLAALRRGESASIPVWSFVSHAREGFRRVEPAGTIVCEGLHALHELPRRHIDIAIYVDAPAAIRWSRWEALERSGVRQLGVEAARQFFHEFAEPIYERFRHGYRSAAHLVVVNDQQK
ncbi:MAG: AAA family ATPase [Planctomycetes bacterium]|nr:AAA family ATPase [Planctomycetota bacterium]